MVQGANWGNRKEHILDRQVKDAVAAKLRALGHFVYDDTDETGSTQARNLSNIVANCNSHTVDLVISFHLNAYNGSANGVEVCYYDQQALAAKVSAKISKEIGWKDRGAKERKELYVLANMKAPAILIELGFIDNDSDMAKWDVDKITNAIVYALTGPTVSGGSNHNGAAPSTQPSNNGVGVVTVTADVLRVRTGSGTNYDIVKKVYQGERYQSWGIQNGWYNVGGDQWVSGDYVRFEG
ncbi:N-acetylmuramoyl-L-alanine amidase [Bacillus sp. FDAARGOS_1420]|uniref:N-acetylmuramoyl-L-alanine amidase n=1 Tax=unclassified Bacillus (in: firmicutes) TaxID=185979 RepID=UPI001C5B9B95|nr:N-acetylmuramoyl-L-alanine amidase [Bacillus sp. FDAARGOS_1420]MBW3496492.1 N-acetylmuramoyl-L-alanine amidase [Bacillus sp. FDAARGOS_1420]